MKFLIVLSVAFLPQLSLYAQSNSNPSCGMNEHVDSTIFKNFPWYGNNSFLEYYLDSVSGSAKTTAANNKYCVPVTAWIHFPGSTWTGNVTRHEVEGYLNSVNDIFEANGIDIVLYLNCFPQSVFNSLYADLIPSEVNTVFSTYRRPNTLNINFVVDGNGFSYGNYPWNPSPYTTTITTSSSSASIPVTLAHEVGHALGLLHTHNSVSSFFAFNASCNFCQQEAVSRSVYLGAGCGYSTPKPSCEVNGDLLCDTDADPIIDIIGDASGPFLTPGCDYNPTTAVGAEHWYDRSLVNWLPTGNNAISNVMSYANRACQSEITIGQKAVMTYWLHNSGNPVVTNSVCLYRNYDVDAYENDNVYQVATVLMPPVLQQHSFHKTINVAGEWDNAACDIDWIKFTPTSSQRYRFKTQAVGGEPLANTKISIWKRNFSGSIDKIGENSNISSTNLFSSHQRWYTAGTEYFIKIENEGTDVGYYFIGVEESGSFSTPIGTDIATSTDRFTIYPNPRFVSSGTTVVVDATSPYEIHQVIVRNQAGNTVHASVVIDPGVDTYQFSTQGWPQGTYFVYAFDGEDWTGQQLSVQ